MVGISIGLKIEYHRVPGRAVQLYPTAEQLYVGAAALQTLKQLQPGAKQQIRVSWNAYRHAARIDGWSVLNAGEALDRRTHPAPGSTARAVGSSAGARRVGGMALFCVHSFFL